LLLYQTASQHERPQTRKQTVKLQGECGADSGYISAKATGPERFGRRRAIFRPIPRQSGCDERVIQDEMPRLDLGLIVAISGFCNA
jgi:hypothetical protein